MPVFERENFVGEVTSMIVKEGDFGPQIEGEITRLDDSADRMVWIPIPDPITKGTTLGRWVAAVAEVEPEADLLDFRQKEKALKKLCTILEGNFYLWENREYTYPTGSKDRLTPVEKYATEELAMAATYGHDIVGSEPSVSAKTAVGGLAVPDAWKGVEEEWKKRVQEMKDELAGKSKPAIIKELESRAEKLLKDDLATPDDFLSWWDEE